MIVTVTLNAAVDRTLTVPNFQFGHRHRASNSLTSAGGKGINVARALKGLEAPVVATGLAGGRTGERIVEDLEAGRPVLESKQLRFRKSTDPQVAKEAEEFSPPPADTPRADTAGLGPEGETLDRPGPTAPIELPAEEAPDEENEEQ